MGESESVRELGWQREYKMGQRGSVRESRGGREREYRVGERD